MKRVLLLLAFAIPASAQQPVDTMLLRRIMALEASNAQLQMMVGVQGFNRAAIPCDSVNSKRPSFTFINGEYDLAFRNRQFGCASTRWDGYQAQITGLAQRLAALEGQAPSTPVPIDGLQAQVSGLASRLAVVEANAGSGGGGAGLSGVSQIPPSGGDIGFQFNTGTVTHRLYGNPADFGLRMWFNYREPYVNGSSYSLPSLPQMALFFEQDGVASLSYFKPQTTPAGTYDNLGGKALAFRGGGWRDDGQREKFVSIYGGQVGRGLQFGVSRTNPNYPDTFDFQIDPANWPNPVSITLGGAKRQLVPCPGSNQVCWQ